MLGAAQLSDKELLAILLATGSRECSALDLAEQMLQKHGGLDGLKDLSLAELMEQKGIGWVACWYDDNWEPPMFSNENKQKTEWGELIFSYLADRSD